MKTHLYKIAALALSLICYVSSASAQTYVDDLYYNKNNESHQQKSKKQTSNPYYSQQTSSKTTSNSDKPWMKTLENDGLDTTSTQTDNISAKGPKTQGNDEYYPGMFAEAVGNNENIETYKDYNHESDYQPSWYQNTVYVTVAPSWYIGFGFGLNPYYYNPWMASPYYGGYWGNPWYAGYPYYNSGYYNSWYYGGYPYYGYYGHSYYPPRYTRNNTIYTGHVRGGSSYRPSGARPSRDYYNTRGGSSYSNGTYQRAITSNRSTTGQYRPSSTTTNSSGQYRPGSTTTRNNGTVSRPTNNTSTYQRTNSSVTRNNNTTYTRPTSTNNNSTYNRPASTNRSTTTYSRPASTTTRSVGTGGGGGGTYRRR